MKSMVLFKFIMMPFVILHLSKVAEGSSSSSGRKFCYATKHCYSFHDVDSSWNEARDECRRMGSQLVTMETTDEWNRVKGYLAQKVKERGSYTHYYIGLRKESGTWKWTEAGSPGATVATNDSRWQTGQPSATATETCAEIHPFIVNQRGHFNNIRCDRKYRAQLKLSPRGYICEDL